MSTESRIGKKAADSPPVAYNYQDSVRVRFSGVLILSVGCISEPGVKYLEPTKVNRGNKPSITHMNANPQSTTEVGA